jgi:hypothetical protein
MKVTNTKTETTMYDTNGKKISIVRKEILEVDTECHLLNREEGKQVHEKVISYKANLSEAKIIKSQLEKVKGQKKGGKIFRDMADLIMVVENLSPTSITIPKGNLPSTAHMIWEAAGMINNEFQGPLKKRK